MAYQPLNNCGFLRYNGPWKLLANCILSKRNIHCCCWGQREVSDIFPQYYMVSLFPSFPFPSLFLPNVDQCGLS
jgi:hypothetical protein